MNEIKPIAHLVWCQFRRAADDVEDYFAVANPGDKCVDGSDAFPVYDDRALAAKDAEIDRLREARDLLSDWIVEGTEDLPDDTPVTIKIGNRSIILDELKNLRAALKEPSL